MLLPLPVSRVRALSLENHLALAAMRSGHGNLDVAMTLLRILYLTWFMRDTAGGEGNPDVFRDAEAAVTRSRIRADQHEGWTLEDTDHDLFAEILALHDQQLASMPSHRYTAAWDSLNRFLRNDDESPIRPARP